MRDYKNLPEIKRRPILKTIILILIFIIVIATLIAVDVALKRLPNILKVTHVYVKGVRVLSKDELFNDLSINASLLKVNKDEIYNKLSRKRWVEKVRMTKIFPDTILIDIKEKKPYMMLKMKDKQYLLDKNGNIIDLYHPLLPIDISKLLLIKQMNENINSKIYKDIYEQCKYIKNKLENISYVKLLSNHYMVVNMHCGIDIAFDPSHNNKIYIDNLNKVWNNLVTKKNNIYLVDACYKKVIVIKWKKGRINQ
ncbi:MAG: FtsQ-type POTRA domain-containing protein [Deltaproteobacteria bacterium]|nr:FtsQ-type POTRA domain-containing protein [Deltaproteobacteria bacterium]